jgi:nitrite reductase/ring-hydroxylating ferredoxin subunit
MPFVDVAALSDLEEAVPLAVRVGRREVVLVRWRDEVFALRNVCPHQSQPLTEGRARAQIKGGGAPGEFRIVEDEPVIFCPWHYYEYELRTGNCPIDPAIRVRTYPVQIDGSRVLLEVDE